MTWLRNKKTPQSRHCNKCGKKFSTTIPDKILCNECDTSKRFCVKCGKELNRYFHIENEKWCSEECKAKLGKEIVTKKYKICNGCRKEISEKSTAYQDSTGDKNFWHVFCRYENIKKEITQKEERLKYSSEYIENTKKEIKDTEIEIENCKKDMEDLANKYPAEVVSQLL